MKVSGIFVGAGKGRRLEGYRGKTFLRIRNKPLFYYSFRIFKRFKELKEFIFVVSGSDLRKAGVLARKYFPRLNIKVTEGGLSRSQSVKRGLRYVSKDADYILIHDIARPFVAERSIKTLLGCVKKFDGCVLSSLTSKTLKKTKKTKFGRRIISTFPRRGLYEVYTPQVFKAQVIKEAYERYFIKDALDDSQLLERAGFNIYIVEGSPLNVKITYPQDLILAKALLR